MEYNVIKISRVSPATNLAEPLILPLTFFDLLWLQVHPTKRVTFYRLTESESSRDSFYSAILPKLEQSLSLVLAHVLPLSGHVKWNPQEPKPHIVVFPLDHVSLTVVETDADFSRVSGKGIRHQTELHALAPELLVSSDSAPILTLQITLFPNQGFCIGTTTHHVVIDGKTNAQFLKSWAHICNHGTIPQDLHLPTVLDRTVIHVPAELESKIFERLMYKVRTLKIPCAEEIDEDVVRITLELTQEKVNNLRERAKSESTRSDLHLSTFVVTYAYVLTCVVKARGGDANRPVAFNYDADFRDRLDPPVPVTYFGNCVLPINIYRYEARTFLGEDGFVNGVEILSDSIKGLSLHGAETILELYEEGLKKMELGTQTVSVAGSNKFGLYGSDFGWGRPVSTENISFRPYTMFTMSEMRDETGGAEISMYLKIFEMNAFMSLFQNGLEN